MRPRVLVTVGVLAAWLLAPGTALAQFETPSRAFHDATSFRLDGRHRVVACESCHLGRVYRGTPSSCVDCHWIRRQDDRFKTLLGTQCESCHRTSGWLPVRWDHASETGVVLNASHRQLACESCHRDGQLRSGALTCLNCHQRDYQQSREPDHAAAGFPQTCETCHRPSDTTFRQAIFDHGAVFALVGRHAQTPCASCHRGGVYKGTPRDCLSCHRADYDRSASPNHAAAGFPTTCETCHRVADPGWRGGSALASFDHATVFPLVGRHGQAACASCHRNNVYTGTPRECVACHREDFDRTTSPSHVSAGFPTSCDTCHKSSDTTWRNGNSGASHDAFFPLQGRHAQTECASCHKNNVFKGTPRACVACHQQDYDRTASPNHAAAGFATTCDTCHRASDATWRGSGFDHNAVFALVGRHSQAACTACHANNVYKGTSRDCVACHRTDYDRTASPNHASAGFSTTCETCHRASDASWRNGNAATNHAAVFPLVGQHAQAACTSCHRNNVYKGTPRDCVACHRTQYDQAANPNHAAAGFPTACDSCHKAADPSWRGASLNHSQFFQLVGQHAQAACTSCHRNNVYKGTPRDCVACHRTQYDQAANPNHAAAGFPTTCDACHKPTDASWRGVSFNHSQFFQLAGRHAQAACGSCHTNNVYKGTSRDCVGCHRATYDRTTNPNHAASGFPTTCESCHRATDTAWSQGRFDHARFPLTGPHNRRCNECHLAANNYQQFSCTVCHERSKTDRDHRGNGGYRYESTACLACHPNGRD